MLAFWQYRKGVSGLLLGGSSHKTFDDLESLVGYPESISVPQAYHGLLAYCLDEVNKYPAGSSYSDYPTWSWIKTNISNGNMPYMCIDTTAISPSADAGTTHAILGIGWEEDSTGNYVRIINEWDNSLSHFFNYKNIVYSAFYLRW